MKGGREGGKEGFIIGEKFWVSSAAAGGENRWQWSLDSGRHGN